MRVLSLGVCKVIASFHVSHKHLADKSINQISLGRSLIYMLPMWRMPLNLSGSGYAFCKPRKREADCVRQVKTGTL